MYFDVLLAVVVAFTVAVAVITELRATLRSDNGDVHENFAEKYRLRILSIFSRLFQGAQLLKRREFAEGIVAEEKAPRPSSDRAGRIYWLAVPVPK